MAKYFDFVLVRVAGEEKNRLYHAPRWSGLESGDEVVVEVEGVERKAVVVASMTVNETEQKDIDFIMKATGSPEEVGRVLKVIEYSPLKYEEEEE